MKEKKENPQISQITQIDSALSVVLAFRHNLSFLSLIHIGGMNDYNCL